MQNPEGSAAAAQRQQQAQAAEQQRETAESLALLREAVLRLTQHAVRDAPITAPTSRLTKLRPEDDVEAYLEVFERTAQRESWPEEQWAHIVTPFLTGPAQQASQDLPAETARQYPALKQAILAYYGHNLTGRAQRFHDWRFDVRGPVRTQIAPHSRLVKRWLSTGEGPSPRDRVLIDNTIRQLPPGARRVLAHHHPDTVDDLVRQLENWQVAQRHSDGTGDTPQPAETDGEPRPASRPLRPTHRSCPRRVASSGGATGAVSPATSPATALETGMCRCRRQREGLALYAGDLLGARSVREPDHPGAGHEPGHAGRTGHRQRGHPPPPRPGGRTGGETHGGDLRARGHTD